MGKNQYLALGAIGLAIAAATPAQAVSLSIQWYDVQTTVPDFNLAPCNSGQNCGQYFSNEVGATLSGGVPVVSASNPASLLEGVGNPLNWWNTSVSGVSYEGTTTQTGPLNQNMFPSFGTGSNDNSGFQTAIITTSVTFGAGGGDVTFGGDDDTFLADGNSIVGQDGGVHPYDAAQNVMVHLGAGTHDLTMFYADRHVTAAYGYLNVSGAVPESSTWAMMLLGFAGLGFAGFRSRKTSISIA